MKYLLPNVPKFFKANLHNHTTVSDGTLTPEESRDAYKALGYSVLAHTDHSVTVSHQALNQPDFLMITGVEIDIEEDVIPKGKGKCRHLCLLSKDPNRQWIPFRDPNPIPSSIPYEKDNECSELPRIYETDAMNAVIAECNRQGFLVTYNHPVWSLENYPDYAPLEGIWGMEYRNSECVASGFDENNGQIYQDLLRMGKFVMPVMADDTHSPAQRGMQVLGGSWTMIGAPKLEYKAVMDALERGDLYSSCGPEIHSLTLEGNTLRITCSPAVQIKLMSHVRWCRAVYAQNGELQAAEFDLSIFFRHYGDDPDGFLRLVVIDEKGNYAVTRAYRSAELAE